MNTGIACQCFQAASTYVSAECADELEWVRGITPDSFDTLTCAGFLEEYCWVVYAAGFRVSILTEKFGQLKAAYCDFHLDRICEMPSIDPALAVINNRRKAESFVEGCRRIAAEGFGRFKARLKSTGMEALQGLPFIGSVTQKHLARNIGLHDVAKDDIWLVRLAEDFHAQSVNELTSYLAEQFGEKEGTVDLILWRFCANGAWERWRQGPIGEVDMPD